MQSQKLTAFTISSTNADGAVRKMTFHARTLSVELVDQLARIEAEIPTIRKRARSVYETIKQFEKQAAKDGATFEDVVRKAMKDSPLADAMVMAYEGRYTLLDIEDSMADHTANIIRVSNAKRIQILRLIADRRKMKPEDLLLLDSPFESQQTVKRQATDQATGELLFDEVAEPIFVTEVVDVDNSFWRDADADELSDAADYFRKRLKN